MILVERACPYPLGPTTQGGERDSPTLTLEIAPARHRIKSRYDEGRRISRSQSDGGMCTCKLRCNNIFVQHRRGQAEIGHKRIDSPYCHNATNNQYVAIYTYGQ